jgi:hypothetical protein
MTAILTDYPQANQPAVRTVLDGIFDQVSDGAPETAFVQQYNEALYFGVEADIVVFCLLLMLGDQLTSESNQIRGSELEVERSSHLHPSRIE